MKNETPRTVPAIQQGSTGDDLVAAINDRFRRLLSLVGRAEGERTSAAGRAGPAGAPPAGGVILQRDGILGIESDAAALLYLHASLTPGAVHAYLKIAPTGADLSMTLTAGTVPWLTLDIPAGSVSATATSLQLADAGPLPPNVNISLSLTAVGTTFPGSDLSVFIYSA